MTDEKDILPVQPAADDVSAVESAADSVSEAIENTADEVKEAVAEVAEAVEDKTGEAAEAAAETVSQAAEAADEAADVIADTAEKAAEAAGETADRISDEIAEEAGKAADAIAETEEQTEEALDKLTEAAPTDHFSSIISAAEHSAEVTAQKPARDDDIYFKMPGEEAEEESADDELQDTAGSMPDETPVIVFENVHKEYEGQIEDSVALTDVSFSIKKGEFVFIVGPSGSGKSTMIRLMMREISPSSGKILIAGKNLAKLRKRQVSKYRRNIGIVFQDFRLLPDRSVYDNVAFAQRVVGASKRNIPKEVSKVLHLVGLSQKYKNFPNELSGGEQQRVAIARALVNNPMIILADEPTGNLDPQNSYEIMSLLEEINRRGTTVVIVTHDREVVNRMQKRVVALQEGAIVEDKRGGYNNRG